MALRLFRSTGYSTLLMPGEMRRSTHPAQVVVGASLWLGLVCNVSIWQLLTRQSAEVHHVLGSAAFLTGICGVIFSLLGWRRTLKPVVTIFLAVGAVAACGLWSQQLPVETFWQAPRTLFLAWPNFMRWQVLALVAVLGLVPMVWMWNVPLRRLRGPAQLRVNLVGAVIGAALAAAGLWLPL